MYSYRAHIRGARQVLRRCNVAKPGRGVISAPFPPPASSQPPQPAQTDSLDWGNSIPSYLQSTIATELCDDWSDAISEAEAAASAAKAALSAGEGPVIAEEASERARRSNRATRVWERIRQEATRDIESEPILSSFLFTSILSHGSFAEALSFVLSNRVADQTLLPTQLFSLFTSLIQSHPRLLQCAAADLEAVYDRDPACGSYSHALLYFKGYHAVQLYRFSHVLWLSGRRVMALSLQSRLSEVLAVDIHPAAVFGKGILMDHGTGVVIGETAHIGNGVSIMQNVTLGGTGKEVGDRHPKVQSNVLIGAGASILGNITVGTGAQVAAGSLVLKPVEAHTMVAGSPAKFVGKVSGNPAASLNQWNKNMAYDMVREDILVEGGRRTLEAKTAVTQTGSQVRMYTEADYYRHIDAEKTLLHEGRVLRDAAHQGAVVAVGLGAGVALAAGATKAVGAGSRRESVDATSDDSEAELKWGAVVEEEPEFFI